VAQFVSRVGDCAVLVCGGEALREPQVLPPGGIPKVSAPVAVNLNRSGVLRSGY
jgi:hypothetical protein